MFQLKKKLRNFLRRDDGTQLIEFAIVFPALLLMFAGTTELGRMFYTYNSLAKASRGGARYLSTLQDVTASTCGSPQISCTTAAKNMVLCGNVNGCGGPNQPPVILPNFTASNIVVTPPATGVGVKYVTIAITGYTYQPLVFNLNALTGGNFNISLAPSTTMRYMRF
ncbi:MAG TPA: TadE/TadG family type IV pilus assembly protein [Pyrinomonadaceae bacterium]|nr:TadE/TadG family type IV pilus assembly protein [Pyrinomonadaceae bacterium]